MTLDQVQRIVDVLGGWPEHLTALACRHGESIMAVLIRDRVIDEAVFGQVCRYALHRGEFDRLSAAIQAEGEVADSDQKGFMSGDQQMRAFHENRLIDLEKHLLATPYARVKSVGTAQTSFMDQLDAAPNPSGNGDDSRKVMPLRPISRIHGRA